MSTIADVFTALTQIVEFIFTFFADALGVITGNPLLFVAVLLTFASGFIFFAYKIFRKFQK